MKSTCPRCCSRWRAGRAGACRCDRARALEPAAIHVVYGHGGEQVREAFAGRRMRWALQAEQLGTGHAVQQAMPDVPDGHARAGALRRRAADARRDPAAPDRAARADDARAADRHACRSDRLRPRGPRRRGPRRAHRRAQGRERARSARSTRSTPASWPRRPRRCARGSAALDNDNAQGEYYLTDYLRARGARRLCGRRRGRADDAIGSPGRQRQLQLAQPEAAHRAQPRRATDARRRDGSPTRRASTCAARSAVGRDVLSTSTWCSRARSSSATACASARSACCATASSAPGTEVRRALRPRRRVTAGAAASSARSPACAPAPCWPTACTSATSSRSRTARSAPAARPTTSPTSATRTIGSNVNVGAGTITCNYDGVNKRPHGIEDGAFIGSDTMLVAPVTIGRDATIGAGSTITKDAPRPAS